MAGSMAGSAAPAAAADPAELHARADAALQSLLLHYWSQGERYLRANSPDDGHLTGYWTFAQGFDAVLDGVERTGGQAYGGLIETFYDAQERRGWSSAFYDDENWMVLALIRAHDLTGDPKYLATARALFADIEGGWDTSCCGTRPGGIWWNKGHDQKATASNAGPVIAAVRLGERTHDATYLDFAVRVYSYWWDNMVNHSTNQVIDHIGADGVKVPWRFTYNEGLMIGASMELYRVTGDPPYLDHAVSVTSYVRAQELIHTSLGNVLHDGANDACGGDCHQFKGIAYRYLMLFNQTRKTMVDVLSASAAAVWDLARSPENDLFSVSWAGPPMSSHSLPQDTSALMALGLWAAAAGPFPGTGRPPDQYEAEEASFHGIGLEATHAGFTGWGYLAGWNEDGQGVDFSVQVDVTGSWGIDFRYAGGAGSAHRAILIDGKVAARDLLFPGTGSWESYGTVHLQGKLLAGSHTISVLLDASQGSSNFLNLDHLRLHRPETPFIRGDPNADGLEDLSDVLTILGHLFLASPASLDCERSAELNGDGAVDLSDALYLLFHLYGAGPAPGQPFPGCGTAAAPDALTCQRFGSCQ
jgi:predicted alpha-1,6-mannanase (GH76 family)